MSFEAGVIRVFPENLFFFLGQKFYVKRKFFIFLSKFS